MVQSHGAGGGRPPPTLAVRFYRSLNGTEPVKRWLMEPSRGDRRAIGEAIKIAQYRWPLGMPLVRKLEPGLWEVRSLLADGIARVLFTVEDRTIVLLHAFVKKSRRLPQHELNLARRRRANLRSEG